jgi:tRNA 2-thiouridine synthesizing protein A
VLRLLASDPAAVIDLPHFCAGAGHRIVATEEAEGHRIWLIQRGP